MQACVLNCTALHYWAKTDLISFATRWIWLWTHPTRKLAYIYMRRCRGHLMNNEVTRERLGKMARLKKQTVPIPATGCLTIHGFIAMQWKKHSTPPLPLGTRTLDCNMAVIHQIQNVYVAKVWDHSKTKMAGQTRTFPIYPNLAP